MNIAETPGTVGREAPGLKRYAPSYIDAIVNFVRRFRIHYGWVYLLPFLLLTASLHLIAWNDGWVPRFQTNRLIYLFPMWVCIPFAVITYLNASAAEALKKFSVLLNLSSEESDQLNYEFTTLPARNVIINSLIWSALFNLYWIASIDVVISTYRLQGPSIVVLYVVGLISFFIGGNVYYHTIRQLVLVNRTVKLVKRFDLFRLEPVYAFSVLTSRTGISWVILGTFSMLFGPEPIVPVQTFITMSLQVALAFGAFFLPLRIVYQRLTQEKLRLMAELDLRIKETLGHLHDQIDQKKIAEAGEYSLALSGLSAEGEILAKIPTLPWRPGLLTGFLSVVVLPMVLFFIQLAISNWLGG